MDILQYIGNWSLKICIFLGTIYLLHQIFLYVKNTFTTPKKTNVIQLYKNQYNEIEQIMKQPSDENSYVRRTGEFCRDVGNEVKTSTEKNTLSDEQKEYLATSLLNILDETM